MADKFLISVGEARAFDTNGVLLFTGKTLLDTSLDIKVASTDIRGGYGAPLIYVMYHSGDCTLSITDAQWNLAYLSLQAGATVATGKDVFTKETCALTGNAGAVTKTPLAAFGSTVYGWLELSDGTFERVTINNSTKAFTSTQSGGSVVCYYYANDAAARTFTVPSNIVPSIIRLVIDTQLASSGSNENIVGKVQFDIPRASLTGNFQVQMKMDGPASAPLNVRALADFTSGTGKFLDISEILTSATWQSTAVALAIEGGDFSLATTLGTKQLVLHAIHSDGTISTPPAADITWASSDQTKATVTDGLVQGVAQGTTTIKASITSKNTIDANVVCTVPAP